MGLTSEIVSGKTCNCKKQQQQQQRRAATSEEAQKGDYILAPLKGKMKVLKKIKRRMGLASRSSSNGGGTNNLPPLLFHNIHGDNIRITRDGTVARRVESFCKGIAFSSRPVKVNEKICIKFLEISNNWSGVIRFGYTFNDPANMRYGLPKYACPDLTNKPGYWAKALPERFCSQNTVLFYYVTAAGDVHFGINGEEKGIFFSGVETRGPLWALIDVYGNSTAIEFVDIRHQLNNSRRNIASNSCDSSPDEVERIVYPMQQVHIGQRDGGGEEPANLPALRFQPPHLNFQPMPLHRLRGRNVRFNNNTRSIASRSDTEFCQGYVFTARPLQLGERVVVQILSTEPMFQGCLGLGLTSCDPGTLQSGDLPDDSNCLLDRPEYWVISRDFARNLNRGDEISFFISPTGEVHISRNGGSSSVVIHVDQTLRLWAFFDIYGSTQRIRVLNYSGPVSPLRNPDRRSTAAPSTSESMNSLNSQSELRRNSVVQSNSRLCCMAPADIQVQPSANGGAVLSVILPPQHASLIANAQVAPVNPNHHYNHQNGNGGGGNNNNNNNNNHANAVLLQNAHHAVVAPSPNVIASHQQPQHHLVNYHPASGANPVVGHHSHPSSSSQHAVAPASVPAQISSSAAAMIAALPTSSSLPPVTTGTMMSTCSNTYIEPISDTSSYSTPLSWAEQNGATVGTGTECTICYENPIDAVLYMCGHMCMCYECALQQWRGKGGGHCPLCRAVIRDVIRTYKS